MEELQQAIAALREYRDTLPEGEERDSVDAEIADAEALLAGDGSEIDPGADTDEDLAAQQALLRDQGFDVDPDEDGVTQPGEAPANTTGERAAATAARKYAQEAAERQSRDTRANVESRVESLVSTGAIIPADREMVVSLGLRLAGVNSGVRMYADGPNGNAQALDDLLTLLGRGDTGALRTYTQHQERTQTPPPLRINAPEHAQINDRSARLAAKVKAYADKNGIKDLSEAGIAMEAELGRDAVLNP